MADLFSAVETEQKKRRKETENSGDIERFGRNPVCPPTPPFSLVCFGISVGYRLIIPHSQTIIIVDV